jgi:hypothetical protein
MSTAASNPKLTPLEKTGLAAAGLFLATLFWSMLCTGPAIPWNIARLAPSFALARGLPVYVLRDSGAHLGWVYGPVMPLWFLPAGLMDNPTTGIMIAIGLNAVALVAPLWIVFRAMLGTRRNLAGQFTVLATILLLANPLTNVAFYIVHVDGLCVGFALVACAALHARIYRAWRPGFPIAAAALALSVATKQVSVILVPATLLWMWREGHGKLAGAWIFWLGSICGSMAMLAFLAFGAEELLFNAVLLFSRMPWRGGWGQLGINLLELTGYGWLWVVAGIAGALLLRREGLRPAGPAAAFARLLGWIALIQAPMGLTASLLVDAGLNSIHAPVYLLIAILVIGGSALASSPETAAATNGPRRLRLLVGLLLVAGMASSAYVATRRQLAWQPDRGQERLLEIVRGNPGKVYLPWNPLVTIIADRKVYPFDEGLRYLWMAGLEPPRAAIQAAVPAGAFILYQEPSQSHFALNYFGKDQRNPAVDR